MIIDSDVGFLGNVQLLARNHVDTVGRYYCTDKDSYKLISATEAQQLSNANIRLFTVFEDPIVDFTKGQANAQSAMKWAGAIGQPPGSAIYFGLEKAAGGFDTTDLPNIRGYFNEIKNTIGKKFDIGIYSNGIPCQAMWQEKICKYTWLAAASYSHKGTQDFFASGCWSLAQVAPTDMKPVGWLPAQWTIDVNVANGDFGSFIAAPPVV